MCTKTTDASELLRVLNLAVAMAETALAEHGMAAHKVTLLARDPDDHDAGLMLSNDQGQEFLRWCDIALGGNGTTLTVTKPEEAEVHHPEQDGRIYVTRDAHVCKNCEAVYSDEPVTQCDCAVDHRGKDFYVGEIRYFKSDAETPQPEEPPVLEGPHLCGFDEAWIGSCKKEVSKPGARCEKHIQTCCSCGAPATRSCAETGQFVCGASLCDNCEHTTFPQGHNGGIGFNAIPLAKGFKRHNPKGYTFPPEAFEVSS